MTKFNFNTQRFYQNSRVPVFKNCNSLTITNTGDNTVTVEDITLYPGTIGTILGDSITIGGHAREVLAKKELRISFSSPQTAGQSVQIIQKYYPENCEQ